MRAFANLANGLFRGFMEIVIRESRVRRWTMLARRGTPAALICLGLTLPLFGISQWVDEGEFSPAMLAYKIRLLKHQFEQTETKLLLRAGAESKGKKLRLEDASNKIKSIEAEFRAGTYYPDLLDEHIVLVQEDLQQILTDGHHTVPADSETDKRSAPPVSVIVQTASV